MLAGFATASRRLRDGYTGQRGQRFTDNAIDVLGPEASAGWLGGHVEIVRIAVAGATRRNADVALMARAP